MKKKKSKTSKFSPEQKEAICRLMLYAMEHSEEVFPRLEKEKKED